MKNLKFVVSVLVGLTFVISCTKEFDFSTDKLSSKIQQNSDVAIPLVNASITLEEILTSNDTVNKYLIIGTDKFLTLIYEKDFAQYPARNYFRGVYSGTVLPYLNQNTAPQTIDIGLDKLQNHGDFYLADPKITISIKNFWDIATRFRFANFNYYKKPNSAGVPVTGSLINQWITINRPVSPAKYGMTTVLMNKANTNMDAVISALPHHLSFSANYETIPGGPYSVDPNSSDSVKVKIEIPLDLRVLNVSMIDTLEFKLGETIEDTTVLKSILLNLIVQNGFPVALDAQIYFADKNYHVLDSISNKPITMNAAKVANGSVTESTETKNPVQIESAKISKLIKAKYLILRLNLNTATSPTQTVKLYSNYKLGLKIGALVKMQIKT